MVDMSAIAGLISSLKAASEMTKAMIGLRDATVIQGKVIELNGIIMTAQSGALESNVAQFALLDRVRDLEQKLVSLEAWEAEKQRYKLTDFGGGTFAYALKPEMAAGEPPHRLCSACYQRGKKSILQSHGHDAFSREMLVCLECEAKFALGEKRIPSDSYYSAPED